MQEIEKAKREPLTRANPPPRAHTPTSTAMVADAGASSGKLYAIVAAPERQRRALSSCVSSASSKYGRSAAGLSRYARARASRHATRSARSSSHSERWHESQTRSAPVPKYGANAGSGCACREWSWQNEPPHARQWWR